MNTPKEAINTQLQDIEGAITVLQAAIDDIHNMDLDNATWEDVAKWAHLVDDIRRSDEIDAANQDRRELED